MNGEHQYVWLLWAGAFLVPWAFLYFLSPALRSQMLRVSAATSLLGLSEPIFVPIYWDPPSLFNLAQRTGFDVESFVFCFAIGGIGSALYTVLARGESAAVPVAVRAATRHRFHALALMTPYLAFPLLYALPWNPIYPGIIALAMGAAATVACRPELGWNCLIGGTLFLALYAVFMLMLVVFAPGYIEHVWNLPRLSGVIVAGIPAEELAFGFTFGAYWAGVFEHFAWTTTVAGYAPSLLSRRGRHV